MSTIFSAFYKFLARNLSLTLYFVLTVFTKPEKFYAISAHGKSVFSRRTQTAFIQARRRYVCHTPATLATRVIMRHRIVIIPHFVARRTQF